ncbi:hypothetical protein [Flavobacterium sp.]|uniref:hypothetical protein n=1 Tax=Flavobacterium sp. TaxID=239 RepID=UPI0025BDA3EF|nr:hypothetical protein [Flavobacterium sp.]
MRTRLFLGMLWCLGTMAYAQDFKFNKAFAYDANSERGQSIYTAYKKAYEKSIADLVAKRNAILNEINQEGTAISKVTDGEKEIKKIESEIRELSTSLKTLNNTEDFKKKTFHAFFGSPESDAFFNVMYSEERSVINFLNNSGFNLGSKSGSVYTELASGNMSTVRLSLGTMVSNSAQEDVQEAKEEEAFQRLSTSGGNTVLTLEYPLLYWSTKDNQYNLISRFIGKATADFPAFGTQTSDFAGSLLAAVDVYVDASTSNGDIRLYANVNLSRIYGTEVYKENLGLDNANFNFGKITTGVVIKNKFNLSAMFKTFSSEDSLENRNVIIGGAFIF